MVTDASGGRLEGGAVGAAAAAGGVSPRRLKGKTGLDSRAFGGFAKGKACAPFFVGPRRTIRF